MKGKTMGRLKSVFKRRAMLAFVFVLPVLLISPAYAAVAVKDLGTFGVTYPIAEKDALQEIEERARQIDWAKVFSREKWEKKLKEYKPKNMVKLPHAEKTEVYQVNMTYTLPFDIPDGKGGILYPKGYTFNPLDYVILPNILVVIDGSDRKQIEWFKKSPYAKDYRTMLLISDGSYWDLEEKLKRPVFYLTERIAERLKLKAVPSVVYQKGRYMEVKVYAVKKASN